ncbi:Uncharacterized conserved protein, contains Mth938-like domain [Nitrosomonas cryotolerans]|nr:Uncharacterized conserved protein, contains Mth938-like domain [Nitrosomonas cryotolerans]
MVNQTRYEHSLIVLPDKVIENWPVKALGQLESEHFECILPFRPEIVLLGTGSNFNFPHHSLINHLVKSGIGIEVMDTKATCRTYNILIEEGRRVAAALLI